MADLRRDLIRDVMATTTAIRNIKPNTQKDMASFETDRHKVPSFIKGRTQGGYSSAIKG